MKLSLILATLLSLSSTAYAESNSQLELERALRIQNLAQVSVQSGNYLQACKAQIEVVDILVKTKITGKELLGSYVETRNSTCLLASRNLIASN